MVNIAGILNHWFHLYRSRFVDSPDMFSVYYSVQVHKHCRHQNPRELRYSILQEHCEQHNHDYRILDRQEHGDHRSVSIPDIPKL